MEWVKADFGGSMEKGAWCVVLRPGFVNGIDPMVRASVGYNRSAFPGAAVASDRAGMGLATAEAVVVREEDVLVAADKREDRPLLLGPMVALNFAAGRQWPGDGVPPPLAIQNRGVPASAPAPKVGVDVTGRVVVDATHAGSENWKVGDRVARTVDLVLGQARLGFQQDITVGDVGSAAMNAVLVSYSTSYNTQAIDVYGSRPFIFQDSDADATALADARAKNPTMMDRLTGSGGTDDNIDKQHILRAWAISPAMTQRDLDDPEFDAGKLVVDGRWELEFEYRTFWNLCYRAKTPMPKQPPPPFSFPLGIGIGGGFGGTIINTYLALQNEITDRLYEAMKVSPQGKFW
jgi:uncharacterized protein (DUF849 family)